ncbi:dual specificity protein phosphatase 22-B-like isoform X1 [Dysidea avara]|uniref:dual specificity protein phosphatase 22-B-like isoform X1 n=1 Tax=Dysidea avara TaxID=196820 RepID=UPI003320438F
MGNNAMTKILPRLYVGGVYGSPFKAKEHFIENKITHVLSIHDSATPGEDKEYVYKCIRCADAPSTDLTQYYEECFEFIHESRLSGGSVFIQCVAGVSRSVTITAMYIMLVTSLSHEQALTIIRQCRPQAGPNIGFRTQLKNYYDKYAETERIKIKEKYPHKTLYDEDEKAAQQLLIDAVENPSTLSYK